MSLYNIVVLFAFGHWSMARLFLNFDFEDRKWRVISHKTTCCFVENDVSFLIKRRIVFIQPTARFVLRLGKGEWWIVKISINAPSRARIRAHWQGVLSFCCHKYHRLLVKSLFSMLLWVVVEGNLTSGWDNRPKRTLNHREKHIFPRCFFFDFP